MVRDDLTWEQIARGEGTMEDRFASKAKLQGPPKLFPNARCFVCSGVAVGLDVDGDPTCGGPRCEPINED